MQQKQQRAKITGLWTRQTRNGDNFHSVKMSTEDFKQKMREVFTNLPPGTAEVAIEVYPNGYKDGDRDPDVNIYVRPWEDRPRQGGGNYQRGNRGGGNYQRGNRGGGGYQNRQPRQQQQQAPQQSQRENLPPEAYEQPGDDIPF